MSLPRLTLLLLMILTGLLGLMINNVLALPLCATGIMAAQALGRRKNRWFTPVCVLFAVGIFLSGSPLTGGSVDGLLLSTALAGFFWAWVQTLPAVAGANNPLSGDHAFTVAFYLSLVVGYLLLRQRMFELPALAAIFGGVIVILLGFALWEVSRRSRHIRANQAEARTAPDLWSRVLSLLAILLACFFFFRIPLPWLSREALKMAEDFGLTYKPKLPEGAPKGPKSRNKPQATQANQPKENPAHSTNPGELPYRARLQLSEKPELCLRIHDPDIAKQSLEAPVYLRTMALSVFQNDQWKKVDYEGEVLRDGSDGDEDGQIVLAKSERPPVTYTLFILDYFGDALPLLQNPLTVKANKIMRSHSDSWKLEAFGFVELTGSSAPIHFDDLEGLELKPSSGELHLLAVDDEALAKTLDETLATPASEGKGTLSEKLTALREIFRQEFQYSLEVSNPDLEPPLTNFLSKERRGFCDHFAMAGALAARRLGVPSRVAFGYAGGSYDAARNLMIFQEQDRHSWTEIELAGQGWTIFDMTPPNHGGAHGARAIDNAPENPEDLAPKEEPKVADVPNPEAKKPEPPKLSWANLLSLLLHYLDWVLVATALALGIIYLVRRARQAKKEEEAKGQDPEAAKAPEYFAEFCALFARLGYPRDKGETLREYCRSLKKENLIGGEFLPMVSYHYGIRYEDKPRQKAEEKGFRLLIREREKALTESVEDDRE